MDNSGLQWQMHQPSPPPQQHQQHDQAPQQDPQAEEDLHLKLERMSLKLRELTAENNRIVRGRRVAENNLLRRQVLHLEERAKKREARIQELERQLKIEKEKNLVGEHLEKLIADMEENEETGVQDPSILVEDKKDVNALSQNFKKVQKEQAEQRDVVVNGSDERDVNVQLCRVLSVGKTQFALTPQLSKDFETVLAEWNDWDQKDVTIEGVDLTYFLFNPMKDDKAIPQVVKKATRNMDVHNIMVRHDNPNANLAEEWNKLSREEKQMWWDRRLELNDLQKYQVVKGWIVLAESKTRDGNKSQKRGIVQEVQEICDE